MKELKLNDEPVVLIEFDPDQRIRQIHTETCEYWVEWSETWQVYLVEDPGSGGSDIEYGYWLRSDRTLEDVYRIKPGAVRITDDQLPETIVQSLETAWMVSSTVYCRVCNDTMPANAEHECQHLYWIEEWEAHGGCGYGEPMVGVGYSQSINQLFDRLGEPSVRALALALKQHCYDITPDRMPIAHCEVWHSGGRAYPDAYQNQPPRFGFTFDVDLGYDPELEPALVWFKSLESGRTPSADNLTVKWIKRWLARKRNAASATLAAATPESTPLT
jgi:hypothetical protein